jgi:hypothetical protein
MHSLLFLDKYFLRNRGRTVDIQLKNWTLISMSFLKSKSKFPKIVRCLVKLFLYHCKAGIIKIINIF